MAEEQRAAVGTTGGNTLALIQTLIDDEAKFTVSIYGAFSVFIYRPGSDTWTTSLGSYGRGTESMLRLLKHEFNTPDGDEK